MEVRAPPAGAREPWHARGRVAQRQRGRSLASGVRGRERRVHGRGLRIFLSLPPRPYPRPRRDLGQPGARLQAVSSPCRGDALGELIARRREGGTVLPVLLAVRCLLSGQPVSVTSGRGGHWATDVTQTAGAAAVPVLRPETSKAARLARAHLAVSRRRTQEMIRGRRRPMHRLTFRVSLWQSWLNKFGKTVRARCLV